MDKIIDCRRAKWQVQTVNGPMLASVSLGEKVSKILYNQTTNKIFSFVKEGEIEVINLEGVEMLTLEPVEF